MKRRYKKLYENNGSITVEASLIVPLIILAIVAVLFICILLYQYSYLQTVSNEVAERGAACWGNISKMGTSNDVFIVESGELNSPQELLNSQLYWRITKTSEEDKIKSLKEFTLYKLSKNNILESEISNLSIKDIEDEGDRVDIWLKDYIIYKELNVVIKDSYKIPLGDTLKIFGLDNKYNIRVHSKAVIDDPLEFIRNTDFITDALKEYEKTAAILERFKESMDKIKENIEDFFEEKGGKE